MGFASLGGASIYDWGAGVASSTPFGNAVNLVTVGLSDYGVSLTASDTLSLTVAGEYYVSMTSSTMDTRIPTVSTTGGVSAFVQGFSKNRAAGEYSNSHILQLRVTAAGTLHFTDYNGYGGALNNPYLVIWDIREFPWRTPLRWTFDYV